MQPDQIAIDNAITVMDMVLAVGLLGVAVTIAAPAITTARSRWLVLAGSAVTLIGVLYSIAREPEGFSITFPLLWALSLMTVAAANDVPIRRLLLVAGAAVVAAPCVLVVGLIVGTAGGQLFTSLAGNPPVSGTDTDVAIALPAAAFGLGLGALSWVLTGRAAAPKPTEDESAWS
jgi:hypothetical protein